MYNGINTLSNAILRLPQYFALSSPNANSEEVLFAIYKMKPSMQPVCVCVLGIL